MERAKEDVLKAIIISTFVVVILVVFTVMFFLLFTKKKKRLQEANRQLQLDYAEALLQSQLEIQEQTLLHVSREIHDNIGQVLSLVSLNLHTLASTDIEKVENTANLVTKAIDDLRNLSKSMNSDRMKNVGIVEAVKQELSHLQKTGKYKTTLQNTAKPERLTPDQTIILYRMIQEVINNIIKHAAADEVFVSFTEGNVIVISDNGKGFNAMDAGTNGIGLQNLKQRAKLISAELDILSSSSGTTIKFTLK